MKFRDFLNEEHLSPSIDDNDVISTLEDNMIFYDRVKDSNSNKLVYKFDNRYSIEYDGELFILFRHGNRIHMANARNREEISAAITKWNKSYSLADSELSDENIDDFLNKMKADNVDNTEDPDNKDEEETDDNDDVDNDNDIDNDKDNDDSEKDVDDDSLNKKEK